MSGWIMWTSVGVFDNVGAVQEGMETIARPQELVDKPDARPLHVTRGEIRFEHVGFHYGRKSGIIDDLSLTIAPGEKVGLVGRSGAGKSTLVNLLLRFYDTESGRILIDGQDIAHATQDSLRSQIGLVTQDTSLLHRSIRDNILYGRPDAGEGAMQEAARQAYAEEFIPVAASTITAAPASMPMSASAAPSCRAASASAWRSPGCCSRTRRSWSSTRRPARSIPRWKGRSRRALPG